MVSTPLSWLIFIVEFLLAVIISSQTRMPSTARTSFGMDLVCTATFAVYCGFSFQFSDPTIRV